MAGWSWRHLLCRNEPENRRPYGFRKRGPGGDDHGQGRIRVHAPCTLVVHAGVLSVYLWYIRRESWDAREGRNARICLIRACVCGDDA